MKHNPDDFCYDTPMRTACPYPDESGYHEVDCVRHKVQGWSLCEVGDTCPMANKCDWSGEKHYTTLDALIAAETVLRVCPCYITNAGGTRPMMTPSRALKMVRTALQDHGVKI
ncbi:MAG: hypothetical protein ACYDHZ_00575 [Dehalococcoidia bacterium]